MPNFRFLYFLKYKCKEYSRYLVNTDRNICTLCVVASMFATVYLMTWDSSYAAQEPNDVIVATNSVECAEVTGKATTCTTTTTTSTTTSKSTSTTTGTSTTISTTATTTDSTTTATEETSIPEEEFEDFEMEDVELLCGYSNEDYCNDEYSSCDGVGQYGYAIDDSEFDALAQVIEHEAGNCDTNVKRQVGVCLLNRVYVSGFGNSVLECKEAPGQYFSGYWQYTQESADIAVELIEAYNSGSEYWSNYCNTYCLTSNTKYQHNDDYVPGTNPVYSETACTTGGYFFTMCYSE